MKILKEIVDEDELIVIKYLLHNTKLMVLINKGKVTVFETNVGSPPGHGFSRVLFIIYFESILRNF